MSTNKLIVEDAKVDKLVAGWVRQALLIGASDEYEGKRQDSRTRWNVAVALRIDDGGTEKIIYTTARDVSLSGIGVTCKERLATMQSVEVWIAGEERCVMGRVMHCTQSVSGFIVGIQFDAVCECSSRRAG